MKTKDQRRNCRLKSMKFVPYTTKQEEVNFLTKEMDYLKSQIEGYQSMARAERKEAAKKETKHTERVCRLKASLAGALELASMARKDLRQAVRDCDAVLKRKEELVKMTDHTAGEIFENIERLLGRIKDIHSIYSSNTDANDDDEPPSEHYHQGIRAPITKTVKLSEERHVDGKPIVLRKITRDQHFRASLGFPRMSAHGSKDN